MKGSRVEKLALIFSIFGKGVPDHYHGQDMMAMGDDSSAATLQSGEQDSEEEH